MPESMITPKNSGLASVEDTRLAINDLNSDLIKNQRIMQQLINSNDPLAIPYSAASDAMIKQVQEILGILKRSLQAMGGR